MARYSFGIWALFLELAFMHVFWLLRKERNDYVGQHDLKQHIRSLSHPFLAFYVVDLRSDPVRSGGLPHVIRARKRKIDIIAVGLEGSKSQTPEEQ
jgi:hypothetical protein